MRICHFLKLSPSFHIHLATYTDLYIPKYMHTYNPGHNILELSPSFSTIPIHHKQNETRYLV